ncbi:MAG: hypothetical protein V2A64_08160 [Candidatus Omnitrophota bacterium]
MKIIKIILLCVSLLFSAGCCSVMLTNHISRNDDPVSEIVKQDYFGTCLYEPNTNIYYTKNLLRGSNRIVAMTIKKKEGYLDYIFISEVDRIPANYTEVPFTITKDEEKATDKGITIIRYSEGDIVPGTGIDYCYGKIENKILRCELNVKKTRVLINKLKYIGYPFTMALDIVTFPIQIVVLFWHLKSVGIL